MRLSWGKLMKRGAENAIASASIGADFRLFLLVTARAGAGGHACFAADEIVEALPKYNKASGVVGTFGEKYLRNLIAAGVDAGLYAPGSSTRCIVLPMSVYDIGAKYKARPCPVHGHNMSYLGGWVDTEQMEQALAKRVRREDLPTTRGNK
ncbi:hypothetical protein ABT144_16455 [Streptomyces sp. NPDC002039]|uniref:hypothetical protein n=1 Tax=Streptomyces sp. NPDC002039 TaxID=3154660 RepID=UPI00332D7C74